MLAFGSSNEGVDKQSCGFLVRRWKIQSSWWKAGRGPSTQQNGLNSHPRRGSVSPLIYKISSLLRGFTTIYPDFILLICLLDWTMYHFKKTNCVSCCCRPFTISYSRGSWTKWTQLSIPNWRGINDTRAPLSVSWISMGSKYSTETVSNNFVLITATKNYSNCLSVRWFISITKLFLLPVILLFACQLYEFHFRACIETRTRGI